MATFMP